MGPWREHDSRSEHLEPVAYVVTAHQGIELHLLVSSSLRRLGFFLGRAIMIEVRVPCSWLSRRSGSRMPPSTEVGAAPSAR